MGKKNEMRWKSNLVMTDRIIYEIVTTTNLVLCNKVNRVGCQEASDCDKL
jgi:hypothetical protein